MVNIYEKKFLDILAVKGNIDEDDVNETSDSQYHSINDSLHSDYIIESKNIGQSVDKPTQKYSVKLQTNEMSNVDEDEDSSLEINELNYQETGKTYRRKFERKVVDYINRTLQSSDSSEKSSLSHSSVKIRKLSCRRRESFKEDSKDEITLVENNKKCRFDSCKINYKRSMIVDYNDILSQVRGHAEVAESWVHDYHPKLVLVGDSHTRHLESIIREMLPGFDIEATIRPGAKSKQVVANISNVVQDAGANDFLVVISGTNDMWSECLDEAKQVIYEAIMLSRHTNLILCNVPNNYLVPKDSPVQDNIVNFNQYYKDIASLAKWTHILELYKLKDRSLFTKHGLHFNFDGKIKICEMISHKVLDMLDTLKVK